MADEEEEKIVAEAVVITADMPDAMKDVSIATARSAMGEYSIDKDVATAIKKKFDEHAEYMGTWHCIVGKNFGCSITHETEYSIFFKVGGTSILLFKSMVYFQKLSLVFNIIEKSKKYIKKCKSKDYRY